jgi:hypothetical protein
MKRCAVNTSFVAGVLAALAACSYDARFESCVVACTTSSGCPKDFTCGSDGLCHAREPVCTEQTLDLTEALPARAQATVPLFACNLPGGELTVQRGCLRFSTEVPASARTLSIDQQRFEVGPCDATAPPETEVCFDYVRPEADAMIRLDNASPTTGCQIGSMTNVQLVFRCP